MIIYETYDSSNNMTENDHQMHIWFQSPSSTVAHTVKVQGPSQRSIIVHHGQSHHAHVQSSKCSPQKGTCQHTGLHMENLLPSMHKVTQYGHIPSATALLVSFLPDRTKGLNKEKQKLSCTIGFMKLHMAAIVFL